MGGPDPILGVRLAHVEVLDQPRRSGLYIKGYDTLPWGSRLTVEALGYITFSRHVTAPDPPMWWGQALLWGSYMKKDVPIESSTRNVEVFDTAIAIMAGLMIIPAVFAFPAAIPAR